MSDTVVDGFPSSFCDLKHNTLKFTVAALGLLTLLLLTGLIAVGILYKDNNREHENRMQAMADDKEALQQNLRTVITEIRTIETQRDDLQQQYNYAMKLKNQTHTNNDTLTEELATLKAAKSQLETSNAALTKELEQTNNLKDALQSNNNVLNRTKQLLQNQYDSIVKRLNESQENYTSVSKERDSLQNKLNNTEQLQKMHNDLIVTFENLVNSYNVVSSEKDVLESSYQNLTEYTDMLQATCNLLVKAQDTLQASYESLVKEKQEIETRFAKITAERDLLRVKSDNLTAQRDQLLEEIQKLNGTICATGSPCPSSWVSFQNRCYYRSFEQRSWNASREYCLNQQADLLIINSEEELNFTKSLYSLNTQSWIGMHDVRREGDWKWVDGSNLTLSFWSQGQPNSYAGTEQDCVEMWHLPTIYTWNDETCTRENYFICEM